MKIKSVRISNILSIEDAYVEFDDNGLMLVEGWNHDVGRANGAGKTAIFNAVSFAIYDKLPRKVTATEVLRRGCRSGFVEVVVHIGETRYTVKRSRPKGVVFQKESAVVDLTQEAWENTVGLNYDQFIMSMYAAKVGAKRFLSVNDSDKKQFLLQLLNLEEFSSCKVVADGKVKTLEASVLTVRFKNQSTEAKIDAYTESLVDEVFIRNAVDEKNKAITQFEVALAQTQHVLRPDLSKYYKLEDEVSLKKAEFAKTRAKRELLFDSYRRIDVSISSQSPPSSTCGTCGSHVDTSAAQAAHEKELEQLLAQRDQVKRELESLDVILSREAGVGELFRKIRERKAVESNAYDRASTYANELRRDIGLRYKELEQLNLKLKNNSDLQSKINSLVDECQELAMSESMILREIELYKTISSMFSPTGAQAYILDSVIDSFNDRVREYVAFLWTNMTYELKSYKENVKGDVTAKFSEYLVMDGKPISIGSLSGGEFRALSLCVDFALIDVMERQFGLSLSPIILDEPFDGLDGAGREFIVELLEKFALDRQVVVVDHAGEVKSMFSKVFNVEKKGGISRVSLLP